MSLFTDPPSAGQGASSFVVSILVHGAMLGLVSYGIIRMPAIKDPAPAKRYPVRQLDLHTKEPPMRRPAGGGVRYPVPQSIPHTLTPASVPSARARGSRQFAQLEPSPQTLIQPELPPNLSLPIEIPIPTVIIWTPEKALAKAIVPPLPQKATAADVRPSIDVPNEELTLANMSVSSTNVAAEIPWLEPSTTSPVVVDRPELLQMVPVTMSDSSAQPTPAAVVSLSDLQMPEGTVTLPPANQTAPTASEVTAVPGLLADSSQATNENPAGKSGGVGAEHSSSEESVEPVNSRAPAVLNGANDGPAKEAQVGSVGEGSTGRFTLPRNGQFGVVVVGASLEEEYPELAQIWAGRMAYTVYLDVRTTRRWILQYSLPRSLESAAEGDVTRLEAPWPYDIVRPHLVHGLLNADALVVHAFVNRAGRFDSLAIIYPPQPVQSKLVLNALQQWHFRPAMKDGQETMVEVVLVIPEDPE